MRICCLAIKHTKQKYVMPGRNSNLFGIDLIKLFNLWEIPINTFCRQLDALEVKKSVQTEKTKFTKVFDDGLGRSKI